MKQVKFAGVIPILATPFRDDESLDPESWQRLIEFMVGLGVDGVTILGVLGESNRLSDHERQALIRQAVSAVNGRLPIIVGTSYGGTRAATYLSRMAQELGADAVMITPAREPVPNDDRIVEMYQQIADGLAIPIVLQDHPASSEVHMPVPLMLRLLRSIPAIQCVKEEAVPTAPKIRQLRDGLTEKHVPILTGLGALYAPFDLEAGCNGFNTGFAFPEVLMAMVAAARAGDWPGVHESVLTLRGPDCVRTTARRGDPKGAAAAARSARVVTRAPSGHDNRAGHREAARHAARAHAAGRRPDPSTGADGAQRPAGGRRSAVVKACVVS